MGQINYAKLWRRILTTKIENSSLREAEKIMQLQKENKALFVSLTCILIACVLNQWSNGPVRSAEMDVFSHECH